MKIQITHELRMLASVFGGLRTFMARSGNVSDAKMGNQSGSDSDRDGILGELAFCQLMNVWPDLGLTPRSGSADCLVKNKRIDIKTTRRLNGRLLCTLKDNPDVDIYVLALLDDDSVTFAGYATKTELRQDANIIDLGHGKGYALDQNKLHKLKIK